MSSAEDVTSVGTPSCAEVERKTLLHENLQWLKRCATNVSLAITSLLTFLISMSSNWLMASSPHTNQQQAGSEPFHILYYDKVAFLKPASQMVEALRAPGLYLISISILCVLMGIALHFSYICSHKLRRHRLYGSLIMVFYALAAIFMVSSVILLFVFLENKRRYSYSGCVMFAMISIITIILTILLLLYSPIFDDVFRALRGLCFGAHPPPPNNPVSKSKVLLVPVNISVTAPETEDSVFDNMETPCFDHVSHASASTREIYSLNPQHKPLPRDQWAPTIEEMTDADADADADGANGYGDEVGEGGEGEEEGNTASDKRSRKVSIQSPTSKDVVMEFEMPSVRLSTANLSDTDMPLNSIGSTIGSPFQLFFVDDLGSTTARNVDN